MLEAVFPAGFIAPVSLEKCKQTILCLICKLQSSWDIVINQDPHYNLNIIYLFYEQIVNGVHA